MIEIFEQIAIRFVSAGWGMKMRKNKRYIPQTFSITLLLTAGVLYLYGNARLTAAVLCCVGLSVGLLVFRRRCYLGERISAGALALMGYTILYAASCLWGAYGSESLPNVASLLIGTASYVLLLAFSDKRMITVLPSIVCGAISVVALLSLDASSAQLITPRILTPIVTRLGGPRLEDTQYEEGMRIVGVLGGANVLAGLLAIGTILGIYLFLSKSGRCRWLFAIILMLNASVFFLAFSLGAFCAFALAVAAYLTFSSRAQRGQVFLCMTMTALLTILCAVLINTGLGRYGSALSFFSLLLPLVFGAVLAALFPVASAALVRVQGKASRNMLLWITAGIASGFILYTVLAVTVSTPITLTPWGTERVAYLAPGEYHLLLTSDEPVKLLIASQNRGELLDNHYNYLYSGNGNEATFTVPEGAGIVRFSFTGSGRLYQAVYAGVQQGEIRMNSPLVPAFVANRMQGVFFSKNILQRIEMCRDGLKLFATGPVFGCGAGAFEAKAYSVQQHYYETKYVHNQYIQCLVDTGAVGLILFVVLLCIMFRQVYRHRDKNSALSAAMLASLVMATVHGFTEVVWSMHAYVIFLLTILAMCELAFSAPLKTIWMRVWVPRCYVIAAVGFSVAVIMHLVVQTDYRHTPESEFTPERIASLCQLEPFSKKLYQLDYVCNYGANAVASGAYLEALRNRESYDINMLLLKFVYLPAWDEENIRTAAQEAYRDRRCDQRALKALDKLLAAYHAEGLFEGGN